MNQQAFEEIDSRIRAGKTLQASKAVADLSRETLAREERIQLARLARRSFVPQIGIRLLSPVVRPGARSVEIANNDEKLEFAACLVWIGALQEALILLDELDPTLHPEADLFRA